MQPTINKTLITISTFLALLSLIFIVQNLFFQIRLNQLIKSFPPVNQTDSWQSYSISHEPQFGFPDYLIKLPPDWKQIEHSSNFQDNEIWQAPDNSQIQITIFDNPQGTLEAFLTQADQTNLTSWEGQPGKRVDSQKNVIVGIDKLNAVERTEDWLAAGFTTKVTYLIKGQTVFSFNIIPANQGNLPSQIAAKLYIQILSTFRFLP